MKNGSKISFGKAEFVLYTSVKSMRGAGAKCGGSPGDGIRGFQQSLIQIKARTLHVTRN
jgi:hypothetical protein